MNERVHVVWNVVVDNQRDAVHVDAACGDVRGDDGADFALFERIQNALTLVLAEVAVQASDVEPVFLQALNCQVHHALGVAENDGLVFFFHP